MLYRNRSKIIAFLFLFFHILSHSHGLSSNQLIHMSDGLQASIKDVVFQHKPQNQILVASYDENNHIFTQNKINAAHIFFTQKLYRLTFDDGETIICTPLQQFLCVVQNSSCWKLAYDLCIGDSLLCRDYEAVQLQHIEVVEHSSENCLAYAISIENTHTFLVGKKGIVTHNVEPITMGTAGLIGAAVQTGVATKIIGWTVAALWGLFVGWDTFFNEHKKQLEKRQEPIVEKKEVSVYGWKQQGQLKNQLNPDQKPLDCGLNSISNVEEPFNCGKPNDDAVLYPDSCLPEDTQELKPCGTGSSMSEKIPSTPCNSSKVQDLNTALLSNQDNNFQSPEPPKSPLVDINKKFVEKAVNCALESEKGEEKNQAGEDLTEYGIPITVPLPTGSETVFKDTKKGDKTSGFCIQRIKKGTFEDAVKDLKSLNPAEIRSAKGPDEIELRISNFPHEITVIARSSSSNSTKDPTLEFQLKGEKLHKGKFIHKIKIRYQL